MPYERGGTELAVGMLKLFLRLSQPIKIERKKKNSQKNYNETLMKVGMVF